MSDARKWTLEDQVTHVLYKSLTQEGTMKEDFAEASAMAKLVLDVIDTPKSVRESDYQVYIDTKKHLAKMMKGDIDGGYMQDRK